MSRIAKNPVVLPKGVELSRVENAITLKGSLGSLHVNIVDGIQVDQNVNSDGNTELQVSVTNKSIAAKAMSGTTRALLQNSVVGVHTGFKKTLELRGVGYRAQVQGDKINLTLGFSHPCVYNLPQGIKAESLSATQLVIQGVDKQQVGQVSAEIRRLRPPEPYKGKGVRYIDEQISIKETKKK